MIRLLRAHTCTEEIRRTIDCTPEMKQILRVRSNINFMNLSFHCAFGAHQFFLYVESRVIDLIVILTIKNNFSGKVIIFNISNHLNSTDFQNR